METTYSTPFSRAILTGVFTGIVTTVICIVFDVAFRGTTHFTPSDIINVSSLIFFTNLLFLIIGIIYYGALRIKKGEIIYIVLFLALTVLFAIKAGNAHRSDIAVQNNQFHELFVPIVIIMGLAAALGIPFLFHNKKFEENVV
jgi:hypothetical protein